MTRFSVGGGNGQTRASHSRRLPKAPALVLRIGTERSCGTVGTIGAALKAQSMDVYEQIQRDEGGSRLKPYLDCCGRLWRACECPVKGKLTIGCGRNLDDRGITAAEGHLMFTHDVAAAKADVNTRLPWAASALDDARYGVLVNMCFNMGIDRLMSFQRMLEAMRRQEWQQAADELMDSNYARQVEDRARRLSEQMRSGRWH